MTRAHREDVVCNRSGRMTMLSILTRAERRLPVDGDRGAKDERQTSSPAVLTAAVALLVAIWCLFSWDSSGSTAARREQELINRARMDAAHEAEVLATSFRVNFAHIRTIPMILATKESVLARLAEFGPDAVPSPLPAGDRNRLWRADPDLADLARQLNRLVNRPDITAAGLWIMNAAGDTIAIATPTGGVDYTGANYSERGYFKSAKRGHDGHQFAIGKIGGIPGIFFASPVSDKDRFIGAVGARINLPDLTDKLPANTLLTDDLGVVIHAGDPGLLMKAVPGARVTKLTRSERLERYGREDFEQLDLETPQNFGGDRVYMRPGNEHPSIVVQRDGDFLSVYSARELTGLDAIHSERKFAFLLQAVAGSSLILLVTACALYFRQSRRHARELARQASTDALTGCANRRFFLTMLQSECDRAARYEESFCVLAIDIDHFKQINDRFGHHAGDQTLSRFADVTRSALRKTDRLGRTGGEEFMGLLPNTHSAEATQIAERIRAAVAGLGNPLGSKDLAITVSIGVACSGATMKETAEQLSIRADEALYRAKRNGRNRVELAVPIVAAETEAGRHADMHIDPMPPLVTSAT
jgi:diguanylate cyclase (GGDEF)-like protein